VDATLAALRPARMVSTDASQKLDGVMASWFGGHSTRRSYLMTDKPLYQPGESIWMRVDLRTTGTLGASPSAVTLKLVSPRGAVVATRRTLVSGSGVGQTDFALPAGLEGGQYAIELEGDDGTRDSRKVVVSAYEAPRLKKSLEFVRKAYGEGDKVAVAVEVARATGEPFGDRALTGVVTVDDAEVARVAIRTDKEGKATARFDLPAKIARGDGLFTLLADDGGVTESMQRRIPIVLKSMGLGLFPEGGELVQGIPGRVYFAAHDLIGKPADVEGRVVDDQGKEVAAFRSIHDGLGRFDLTPVADRSYKVEITKPAGVTQTFAVPAAKSGGCVVRGVPGGAPETVRVAAICDTPRTVMVLAAMREQRIASGSVEVRAGEPALLELPVQATLQGAVRVTLFSSAEEPLAERLGYHGRRSCPRPW
jgi:hypothetical protein